MKVIHLRKVANLSMLNDALVIKNTSNSFSESKKNFNRLTKLGTKHISIRLH